MSLGEDMVDNVPFEQLPTSLALLLPSNTFYDYTEE